MNSFVKILRIAEAIIQAITQIAEVFPAEKGGENNE